MEEEEGEGGVLFKATWSCVTALIYGAWSFGLIHDVKCAATCN